VPEQEPNDYERAVTRMEAARENLRCTAENTTRAMNAAERECTEAERNLREHESRPGIPLPQYRRALEPASVSSSRSKRT
jgi:hypothetical protein